MGTNYYFKGEHVGKRSYVSDNYRQFTFNTNFLIGKSIFELAMEGEYVTDEYDRSIPWLTFLQTLYRDKLDFLDEEFS